jgi:hypothetical protein
MSKNIRRTDRGAEGRETRLAKRVTSLPIFIVAATILAAGLTIPTGRAQRTTTPSQNPLASSSARNAAVAAATEAVLKETSDIRQLSILRPVQSGTKSRSEIERMIITNLDEDMTPNQMHAAEASLKKLGLASSDFQFRPLMIKVLTEQVAGYYEPKSREFYLADWIDLDGQKPIMAHELTHALQDQHFNLRRFEHWPKGDSDAELAAHALIEGDATLAMMLYVANNPMRALAFLKSLGGTEMSSQELDKAPRALRETLLFPYTEGTNWTRNLYKQGGWDRVSKAFIELPQSTEQIIHPEKYFAHEAPVKVTLPDITSLLNTEERGQGTAESKAVVGSTGPAVSGKSSHFSRPPNSRPSTPAAWRRLDYDVEGEWGFYLLLDQFLKAPLESRRAAAGWGGDRFEVYEGPHGEVCWISLSVWDTENDAREFFDAYLKRTQLRYPNAELLSGPGPASANSQGKTDDFARWKTSEGIVAVNLHGARATIVEGLPESADVKSILSGLVSR